MEPITNTDWDSIEIPLTDTEEDGKIGGFKVIDLFPYKIKDREKFYFRNHPKQLHPESPAFKKYWDEFERYIIEGKWINDNGTWVYMMPKLFFYINYARIVDSDRNEIFPNLRDNEWIIFSYLMCVDGFSGFEGDDEVTCHDLVRRLENPKDELNSIEIESIPDSAKRPDGKYKKYIDPWEYLTRYYLVENPPSEPLGLALYENQRYNACILSARGVGKSFTIFVGDFVHEFLTSGAKRMDGDYKKQINKRLLFGMGSADGRQLDRSIKNIRSFYYNQPGQYEYRERTRDGKKKPNYMGPFYKKVQGTWEAGGTIQHLVKKKNQVSEIEGSSLQMVSLTSDQTTVGAGDRFRRAYVEEFGFLKNALAVHSANKDSLKSLGKRVGSAIYLGTGGDMDAVKEPKRIFEHPDAYDIFGIPDYWKNPKRKIGLFIPVTYAYSEAPANYKDKNGNTILDLAYKYAIKEREKLRAELDAMSYDKEVMFNPLLPEEMLRPSSGSVLPKQAAQDQLNDIEAYDIFVKKAQIGKIQYNPLEPRGVEWRKDMTLTMRPILKWDTDDQKIDKEGAVIIYEQPPEYIPPGLYWIVYDPAKQSGDGQSFHSIIVYKHFYRGPERTMYDTIVAEWIGRKERLDDNYEMVIKMAKYFNARIFPEINVAGFVEWCRTNNHYRLLEDDAYALEMEINPKHKRSYYKKGFSMNDRKKNWCLDKLRDWLLETKEIDALTGVPIVKTMDWIFSPRILDEIINYSDEKNLNFDHISSLLGLMLLIGKLDGKPPADLEEEERQTPYSGVVIKKPEVLGGKVRRAKFLQY